MTNGGNKNVKELFDSYELFDMPFERWYRSKIANWNWSFVSLIKYKLKAVALDQEFDVEKPSFDEGRETVDLLVTKSHIDVTEDEN